MRRSAITSHQRNLFRRPLLREDAIMVLLNPAPFSSPLLSSILQSVSPTLRLGSLLSRCHMLQGQLLQESVNLTSSGPL